MPVGGPKQRALLALLLLSANRVVSRDTLVGELFAELGVNSADHALRNQVSRLRKVLMPGSGRRAAPGRTRARATSSEWSPASSTSTASRRSSMEGREALAGGDPATAAAALRAAEALWSGRPLADLEFEPFARVDVERLEEVRLAALEDRLDADLALGRHVALVERAGGAGRRASVPRALPGAAHARPVPREGGKPKGLRCTAARGRLLNEELGLEPGVQLQQLERAILVQDPALERRGQRRPKRPAFATDRRLPVQGVGAVRG